MSSTSNYASLHLHRSVNNPLSLPRTTFQFQEFRVWRRRRQKLNSQKCGVRNQLGPLVPSSFETLFQNLVSQFPSVNSLDLIAPALGLASGVAFYISRLNSGNNFGVPNSGEWILFASPTPFNRFVLLRCPSILFQGRDFLEDVNEKLVKEGRHFVKLNSGRTGETEDGLMEKLVYQRECVRTDDGGVISLDWPADLNLREEHGLDTTLLLIPGTTQGSMDNSVRSFVCESLKSGCFPVVMNPRGCAASPLTTPRLFTAADSDDVYTAIQFINKVRPQATLMAVSWGFGANMLTKYLAEVGERTPLTAATCIDSPFDLEEATRSIPHHIAIDQNLTGGLIDILRSNKELFQGRSKGFDVEKALLAKSVRDFDKAISMVSYGFDAIEDFYSASSTQTVVGNIKIPVLFIQNDDGMVPVFSIPRSLIAENPFTSLLLCSCLPSSVVASGSSVISWSQPLAIQWLTAVEFGLLKGRHPLLEDVDVTFNPSKALSLVEGRKSGKGGKVIKFQNHTQSNALNPVDPMNEMNDGSDLAASIQPHPRGDLQRNLGPENKELQQVDNGVQQVSSVDAEVVKEDGASSVDDERGQVLQTAQLVMNMLDTTMPNALTEEKKKKVLTAVGQGETVMKALQDAVPEDVRDQLTTAVSGIVNTQGSNINFDRLMHLGRIPKFGSKSNIQEKDGGLSNAEGSHKDPHSSDSKEGAGDLADGLDNNQSLMDQPAKELESELQPSEKSQKSDGLGQSTSNNEGDTSGAVEKNTNELGNYDKNNDSSIEKPAQQSDSNENGSENDANSNIPSQSEKASTTDKGKNMQQTEEKTMDSSIDQTKIASSTKVEETNSSLGSSSEAQPEGNDNQKGEEDESTQPVLDQNKSNPSESNPPPSPTFDVSHAFNALTGIDDSTQVAVQSVFGVIENMITHMEEEKDNGNEVKDKNEVKDEKAAPASENHLTSNDNKLEKKEGNKIDLHSHSDILHDTATYNHENHPESAGWVEEKSTQSSISLNESGIGHSQENNMASLVGKKKNEREERLVGGELDIRRHVNNVPLYVTTNPYGDSFYNEYFQRYLRSKVPNTKSLDLDTTTALLLDYTPEDNQWKLVEQPGNSGESNGGTTTPEGFDRKVTRSPTRDDNADQVIEPSYVILDTEKQQEPFGEEYETVDRMDAKAEIEDDGLEGLMRLVKNIVLDSLKVEVCRKLSAVDMKEAEPDLSKDLEQLANAVSLAVQHNKEHVWCLDVKGNSNGHTSEKIGTIHGEHIVKVISFAVQDTHYLKRVLPVGVIVGSTLAALRKVFDVATVHGSGQSETMAPIQVKTSSNRYLDQVGEMEVNEMPMDKTDQIPSIDTSISRDGKKSDFNDKGNGSVMFGAVTAALGASALLVHGQNQYNGDETAQSLTKDFNEKSNHQEPEKFEEMPEKNQNNMVTSLAEKAMSVAAPVVPTKEDGGVDQDRLVAMLADLGQRGGMLRLVGKLALLWGGIRGAVSLTEKLFSFLRLADRPLYQRMLGFVCMVIVLWSPVVVPLLPTLVQGWATHNSSRISELICIVALYTAVIVLVMLWGKRVRGYENPFKQYGLDFASWPKIQTFAKAFLGGVVLVLSIQSVNALLGYVSLSWPIVLSSPCLDPMTWLKVYGKMFMLGVRATLIATAVALVEELLFRSWLPEEIAADLGYHRGIIISGLAFSLIQGSPRAIPGLWALSLGLAGAQQRSQGSLSIPIGLRAGIMASSFVLQNGGFLTYRPNFLLWVTGTHPFQPFSGLVGLAFSLVLAVVLYPRQPLHRENVSHDLPEVLQ